MKKIRQEIKRSDNIETVRQKKENKINKALDKNEKELNRKKIESRLARNELKNNVLESRMKLGKKPGKAKKPASGKTRTRIPNSRHILNNNAQPYELKTPDWFRSNEDVDVSIIVPLFKSNEVIKDQIESWDLSDDGLKKEIIYCDDACPFKSHEVVYKTWESKKFKIKDYVGKIIINKNNVGYGPNCNVGVKFSKGKYLIFLNADCTVSKNWIKPLIDRLESDSTIGIVGNLQLDYSGNKVESAGSQWSWESNSFQHIGKTINNGKKIKAYNIMRLPEELRKACEREMVTGCCFAIRRDLFLDLGGYDEEYKIGYWEDSEMNLQVKEAGYKIYYEPKSVIYHKVGHTNSAGHHYIGHNRRLFYTRWIDTGRIDTHITHKRKDIEPKTLKQMVNGSMVGCVIACNEEEFLEASVESASPLIDRWVFVIGGNEHAYKAGMCDVRGYPTDNTLEIARNLAKKYNGIVVEPPSRLWHDKVEMRNAYTNYIKENEWMFMVDGDEVYKPRQLWRIAELTKKYEVLIMQFWLFWNNVNTIGNGKWDHFPQERIVKWKKGYGYRGKNHLHVSDLSSRQVNHTVNTWKGKEKLFYHYSWVRPIEKIRQKLFYYKYQTKNNNDNYVDDIFLKWRENPKLVNYTHPMSGGSWEPFPGIHPKQVQKLIDENKLNF